jgi:drug/metabolite transporter (DMT)-like permease
MLFLVISILCSVSIILVFKFFVTFRVHTFTAIVYNYIVACLLGWLLLIDPPRIAHIFQSQWLPLALIIGILFILMFFVIAITTQRVGITPTAISGRLSVVLPILFSIIYFNETLNVLKVTGLVLAIPALALSIFKKRKNRVHLHPQFLYLPLLLFLGTGIIDSLVKLSQEVYIPDDEILLFSTVLFGVSALSGLLFKAIFRTDLDRFLLRRNIVWGFILGIVNLGSLYFLIMALNLAPFDSSVIFGMNNMGIVLLSVFAGVLFFREKLSIINWIGIGISVVAIFVLSNA